MSYSEKLYRLPRDLINIFRKYEATKKKLINAKWSAMFNETCISENLWPNFTNIKNSLHFSKSFPDISTWKWVSLNKRSYDVILARLRSGCIQLNEHLNKINMSDSPLCNYCNNMRETVEHFIFECQKYSNLRRKLYNELALLGVNQDEINLQLLLSGEGTNKHKKRILNKLLNYVKSTNRFDL